MKKPKPQTYPLYDVAAERALIGAVLNDQSVFWNVFGRVAPEFFTVPRNARIWHAMIRAAEAGKPISANWIPLMIKDDGGEDTPLMVYLNVLRNDAPPASDAEAYAETVVHLSQKRALLDALEVAKAEIIGTDVGSPAEAMRDTAIRKVSAAFSGDADEHMMSYGAWGDRVVKTASESFARGESGGYGLSPGLQAVQEVIGLMLPGKLYVLAGMSGGGKSALARQITEAAALDAGQQGLGDSYIASLEMTGDEYAARSFAEHVGIPSSRIEAGNLNAAEVENLALALPKLKKLPIIIDSRPRQSFEQMRARALKVKNQRGLAFIVIDHLLLIRYGRNDSFMERVAQGTLDAKDLAKELGVPVLMLAQLDEKKILESASGWPNSSHLFGGQTIMQNADAVFFIHRPEVVHQKKEPSPDNVEKHTNWVTRWDSLKGKAYVFSNKLRGGEPAVKRELLFHGPTTTFQDV